MISIYHLLPLFFFILLIIAFSILFFSVVLITGQAVSPIIRFMTHTGEWVWVQIQGLVRYEADNKTPKYLEASFKVVW